ncbi:MAG TPA: ABC transporter ATP-binding protein [Firmicutes bacterium]|nr:ABC transporter ATP-binding protein [Bacillota bacterium]
MPEEILLDIKGLNVWYRVYGGYLKVVHNLSLQVYRGERVGLVGEAGCGKTTTMKAILRILPESVAHIPRGEIIFRGRDVLKMNRAELQKLRSRGIAMIFQDPTSALNPVFTVGEQLEDVIRFALPPEERQKKRIHDIAVQALKEVYLPDQERILQSYPVQLSGGMRQRICISMAITTPRELLIADEPGTSLDVTIQDQILRLLRELVEKHGTSIILITHSLGVARQMTDRIYVMYAGSIVEAAPSATLFKEPLHPYTVGLLASVPKISGGGIAEGIPGRIPNYLNPPNGCRFQPRCSLSDDRCLSQSPPILDVGGGHYVACFRYER